MELFFMKVVHLFCFASTIKVSTFGANNAIGVTGLRLTCLHLSGYEPTSGGEGVSVGEGARGDICGNGTGQQCNYPGWANPPRSLALRSGS